jgi:hypothetical protein
MVNSNNRKSFEIMEHKLFNEMKTIQDRLVFILAKYPATQDDDKLLYSYFVIYMAGKGDFEAGKKILESTTALDFIRNISKHQYVNYASLIRSRRLIQMEHIHLRGTKWAEKHEADKFFQKNINNVLDKNDFIN